MPKSPVAQGARIPLLTSLAICAAALCDLPERISIGPVSGSAAISVVLAILGLVTIPKLFGAPNKATLLPFLPWVAFSIWSSLLCLVFGASTASLQTISLLWVFVTIAMTTASFTDDTGAIVAHRRLVTAGWVIGTLYIVSVISDSLSLGGFIGQRSFAIEALVIMAAAAPHALSKNLWIRRFPAVFLVLIFLSLSRMAMFVGTLLFTVRFSFTKSGFKGRKLLAVGIVAGGTLLLAIASISAIRNRFVGGDRAIQFEGISLSTQGRDRIWTVTSDGIATSPIFGHGPGAVRGWIAEHIPGQTEPHNDFLRVFYDSGIVGLSLFVLALITLIVSAGKRALHSSSLATAAPHASAILAILAFVLGALTDNPIVYFFVVAPMGVVVGLSMREPINPKISRKTRTLFRSRSVS